MKSIAAPILLACALVFASTSGCSSEKSNVDANAGKAISDLDIGGDLTLDKGKTQQMTATLKYADGTAVDATKKADLVWNMGNTNVATITKEGLVTGVSPGATTIKATYQGKESASHALIVK